MSDPTPELLKREAEHAETNKDAPEHDGTVALRPGGKAARVYSLRLSESEVRALEAAAARIGMPASTLARTWISERLATEDDTIDVHAIADALAAFSRRLSIA